MSSPNIEIHEFSTGIHFQPRANGWVSLGFTGQYMNTTMKDIPTVVERSIANQEFALTEGSSTKEPAIIGRVVGSGDDVWSVMAVVTRGQVEVGRSAAFYRYFLCEGNREKLRLIIAWWESKNSPTFNPLDTKTVSQPNKLLEENVRTWNDSDPEWRKLSSDTSPLLKPREHEEIFRKSYILLNQINALAIDKSDKSNKNSLPIAWAFNVEALEKPERFQVIQPASPKAYDGLKRAIANAAQVVSAINVDEAALKSAIRSLMNSSTIKPEAVQEIVKGLENEEIESDYWESLFNAQGADKAIKQKIYSPQMVRLITLRAMVIPETLPEFLEWLNIQGGKKPDENQTVSLDFQSKISRYLKEQIIYGIEFLMIKLLQEQITPERVAWLFKVKGSVWTAYHKDFVTAVKDDLNIIAKAGSLPKSKHEEHLITLNFDGKIWSSLITRWGDIKHGVTLTDYSPLAKLFESTEDYKLAAYFYQVSSGSVPKDIFSNLSDDIALSKFKGKYLGLNLRSKKTTLDKLEEFANDNFVPIATGIILSVTLGMLSLLWISFSRKNNIRSNDEIHHPSPHKDEQIKAIEKYVKSTAIAIQPEKFDQTISAIIDISSANNNKQKASVNQEVFTKIMQKLNVTDNSITYNDFIFKKNITSNEKKKKIVAGAIYSFQQKYVNKRIKATGYLDKLKTESGFKQLKDEVLNHNNSNLPKS
jgi:hypothetical protein